MWSRRSGERQGEGAGDRVGERGEGAGDRVGERRGGVEDLV